MKRPYWIIMSLFILCLTACSRGSSDKGGEENSQTQGAITGGKMDTATIKAPQVGLTDDEWNHSLGTKSDGKDTNLETNPTRILSTSATSIVIYFSRSGSTELLASKVQALSGADVIELVAQEPYSADYGETVQRANQERQVTEVPKIEDSIPDLSQYDRIYLGFPIWGMTLAEPVATFVETHAEQLNHKTILPFSTNGGYGLGSSFERIQTALEKKNSQATITEAFAIEGNKADQADESLREWFERIGGK